MKIPLFDLDGTLLQSGRGNKPHQDAFNFALKSVYHLPNASFFDIIPDGMVDNQIFVEIVNLHGVNQKEAIEKLPLATQAEIDYYMTHKDEQPSLAHHGSKELLELLMPQTHCGVLTGNIEQIGWEKLRQAGLLSYISFGSFGNLAMQRVDLIGIAKKRYEEKFREERPLTDFVIIGDTPRDIFCAKDGGIQVIAVATGNYTYETLAKENPDLILHSLEEKEKIIEFLQVS